MKKRNNRMESRSDRIER